MSCEHAYKGMMGKGFLWAAAGWQKDLPRMHGHDGRVTWTVEVLCLPNDFVHHADTYTCADLRSWGSCNATWVLDNNYCRATCGACAGPPPPPLPPSLPPPPPQPNSMSANFDVAEEPSGGWSMYVANWDAATNPQVRKRRGCAPLYLTPGSLLAPVVRIEWTRQ